MRTINIHILQMYIYTKKVTKYTYMYRPHEIKRHKQVLEFCP